MWTSNWILHGLDDFVSRDRTLRANDNCTSETSTEPNSVIQDTLLHMSFQIVIVTGGIIFLLLLLLLLGSLI